MKGYIERIEATKEQKEAACDDMYNEPKIPESTDTLASIEMLFYNYRSALEDDDLITALKYKEAILKIKAVTESVRFYR